MDTPEHERFGLPEGDASSSGFARAATAADAERWALRLLVITMLAKTFQQAPDVNAMAADYEKTALGYLYDVAEKSMKNATEEGRQRITVRAARQEAVIGKIIASAAIAARAEQAKSDLA
jgi:hypothetical protein